MKISANFDENLSMRAFTVLFFLLFTQYFFAQQLLKGVVLDEYSKEEIGNVTIINLTTSESTTSYYSDGHFQIIVKEGDQLQFIHSKYNTAKVTISKEFLYSDTAIFYLQDNSYELDEIVISTINLTGILEIDSHLIAFHEYPYTGDLSITPYSRYTTFNPIHSIYKSVQKNSKEAKRIKTLEKDAQLLELMKTRFDRELVSGLLQMSKKDIIEQLKKCNYAEGFIMYASDYQIFMALSECYKNN